MGSIRLRDLPRQGPRSALTTSAMPWDQIAASRPQRNTMVYPSRPAPGVCKHVPSHRRDAILTTGATPATVHRTQITRPPVGAPRVSA